ncbi:hypothetical protein ACF3DV_24545 [Chlorogloeopsis fritschii PCC 9212]|uniref:hypothetical protein n=1 Tax=Chlorogloeopsis fritschii TaxID=1124 RepID=UPI000F8C6578|nr:hypothetical protein [Chlorogloeopsis fritschii]MBF2009188.1 hypothetical protein [Chlorogloeopsis fritschii C42_A2020_084]
MEIASVSGFSESMFDILHCSQHEPEALILVTRFNLVTKVYEGLEAAPGGCCITNRILQEAIAHL